MSYNGQGSLTFNVEILTWLVPAMPSAQPIKELWETEGPRADLVKLFLHETCLAQLWKYLASWRGLLGNTGTALGRRTHSLILPLVPKRKGTFQLFCEWLSCPSLRSGAQF